MRGRQPQASFDNHTNWKDELQAAVVGPEPLTLQEDYLTIECRESNQFR